MLLFEAVPHRAQPPDAGYWNEFCDPTFASAFQDASGAIWTPVGSHLVQGLQEWVPGAGDGWRLTALAALECLPMGQCVIPIGMCSAIQMQSHAICVHS